jgi:hypothetical protein
MAMTMTTTTAHGLPAAFGDMEPFSHGILETQPERYALRLASSMDDMQAFYDLAFPRIQDMIDHCQQYPIEDLPDDVKQLMYLIFSLVEVSFPVECWRQARVPDSGSASMDMVVEPTL